MNSDYSELRREYVYTAMNEADMNADPVKQFADWLQLAIDAELDLPNAMLLATASKDGLPSARYVLLKGFDDRGFVFYSHADSVKGRQLADNPRAALVFYWAPMHRQVRIEGGVERVTDEDADEYFKSRPYDSRAIYTSLFIIMMVMVALLFISSSKLINEVRIITAFTI